MVDAKQVTPCFLTPVLCFLMIANASALFPGRTRSIIKEGNRQGPYYGLITVYPPEENAFFATGAFRPHRKHPFVYLSGTATTPGGYCPGEESFLCEMQHCYVTKAPSNKSSICHYKVLT